ncbi:ATP-dependent RNA helicase RhlE [Filimonas lacunae]|uniref:ATP-dependent RNA helicase RhlE n=1 Tax=Filimonas lacunae TaxID=477680 RepID=A0A173M9K9_9BACT|nr:DEAD/DEAH box helicase [Filimonas lacunae]BAV04227.1 ATP-dependent RNA helicase RhlE [Filimonas lacunae]SIT13924.1 ATP-dependent RNA helicase RhlE [Filimonas lacunae]
MTFNDLNLSTHLLKALDELGYTTPTTIQRKAFSVIMSGQDVIGIAQTGTGKTMAYLLPTLRQLTYSKERNPQMLILVPTRELVVQVVEAAKKLTTYMSLEVAGVYGGVNINPQKDMVEQGLDVLVATPGRLFDLAACGSLRLKGIKKLVIDEMDEMLNLGFRTQLTNILDMLPAKRQNLLFSATIPDELASLIGDYFNSNITRIEAAPAGTPLDNIQQSAYHVPNFYTKINLLLLLLQQHPEMSKVLIFVATKALADELYEEMAVEFPDQAGVIHSNKEQNYRFNTVKQFQNGTYRFIIATDIVARGIDISEVTHVINFDLPEVPENYIHRIGRTGRADKHGIALSFITEREREQQEAIEALMNYAIPIVPLPEDLEISTELTEDEKPKVYMKVIPMVLPDKDSGASFHEKKAKNTKVNVRVSHAEKMMQKYGKPKKRPKKR